MNLLVIWTDIKNRIATYDTLILENVYSEGELIRYSVSNSSDCTFYSYDSSGKLMLSWDTSFASFQKGDSGYIQRYRYDEHGNRIEIFHSHGKRHSRELFNYNPKNQMVEYQWFTVTSESDTLIPESDTATLKERWLFWTRYEYNREGKLSKEIPIGGYGSSVGIIIYSYDENGFMNKRGDDYMVSEYENDKDGNRIREKVFANNLLIGDMEFIYTFYP
ncbi:MAG TPA: hypothetical protein VE978_00790 [Chitinophagales bacterium]|nr:hypothetical protein [Chitinophagales bacterium]